MVLFNHKNRYERGENNNTLGICKHREFLGRKRFNSSAELIFIVNLKLGSEIIFYCARLKKNLGYATET